MNLEDQDYDDTVTMEASVYEHYVPRASVQTSVNTPQPAPISRPRDKGIILTVFSDYGFMVCVSSYRI